MPDIVPDLLRNAAEQPCRAFLQRLLFRDRTFASASIPWMRFRLRDAYEQQIVALAAAGGALLLVSAALPRRAGR
jgi:hypothetical protein